MDFQTGEAETWSSGTPVVRRAAIAVLLCVILALCALILRPFFSPILWAAILAYVTWPLYRRLRVYAGRFETAAASVMTLLVVSVAFVPVAWMLVLVQHELLAAYRDFTAYIAQGPHALPRALREIPVLGGLLQDGIDRYTREPDALGREIAAALQRWSGKLGAIRGDLGRDRGKLLVALLTLFFFYRDGNHLVDQSRRTIARIFGDSLNPSLQTVGVMTRAVVYGLLITVVLQGVLAGIAYRIVGLDAPVLLGTLTGLLATAPLFGTGFVWCPVAALLLIGGHVWQGVFLLAWGFLIIHPVDNILRAVLVSSATHAPFLLVMFGALGGLAACGLIGALIGPVILGLAAALWSEWTAQRGARG